jgi:hypothetical protein
LRQSSGEPQGERTGTMKENTVPSDAVADFLSNRPYERRIVIFYDILGWRNHIEKAGKDLEKIGESKIANFPRIVVDQEVFDECGPVAGFNAYEDGIHFLDPFNADFIQFVLDARTEDVKPGIRNVGVVPPNDSLEGVRGPALLKAILGALKREIRSPLSDKEWEKIAWLYDRIALRLGVPLAKSYPRAMSGAE